MTITIGKVPEEPVEALHDLLDSCWTLLGEDFDSLPRYMQHAMTNAAICHDKARGIPEAESDFPVY